MIDLDMGIILQERIIEKETRIPIDKTSNLLPPLGPWYIVICPDQENKNLMKTGEQQYYQSSIGSLLHLIVKARF
jgi:hypothetical protein